MTGSITGLASVPYWEMCKKCNKHYIFTYRFKNRNISCMIIIYFYDFLARAQNIYAHLEFSFTHLENMLVMSILCSLTSIMVSNAKEVHIV